MTSSVAIAASCQRGDLEKDAASQQADGCAAVTVATTDEDSCVGSTAVVHRKHKKIHRSSVATITSQESTQATETHVPSTPAHTHRKPANPYVAYRNIKMKVLGWILSVKELCCLTNNNERFVSNLCGVPVN